MDPPHSSSARALLPLHDAPAIPIYHFWPLGRSHDPQVSQVFPFVRCLFPHSNLLFGSIGLDADTPFLHSVDQEELYLVARLQRYQSSTVTLVIQSTASLSGLALGRLPPLSAIQTQKHVVDPVIIHTTCHRVPYLSPSSLVIALYLVTKRL